MSIGLCEHVDSAKMCQRSRGHEGEHVLVDKTGTTEERFMQISAQFPVDPVDKAQSLRDFMEDWYDRWAGPGEDWNFRDLAESIVEEWLPAVTPKRSE